MSKEFTDKEIEILKRIADKPIFKNFVPLPKYKNKVPITLHRIAERVCNYYEISQNDFFSKRRSTVYVHARRDYCHLATRHTKNSKYLIGLGFGKDHATVLHHLKEKPINADRITVE